MRRTSSEWAMSTSATTHSSALSEACTTNSPCGPAMNDEPQNLMPEVAPEGSCSCPTLLTATTYSPLATACPRCTVIHASRWRACSSGVSFKDEWASLLEEPEQKSSPSGVRLMAAASSISDVRVAPMVQSKWNQAQWNNYNTFNYYIK